MVTQNDEFIKFINNAVKKFVQERVENEFDEMIKKLNGRKNEICASVVMGIVKEMQIDTSTQKLVIDLKEIK